MDTNLPAIIEDADADRLCLEAAVAASRQNTAPGRSHDEVRVDMRRKIAELDARIAALSGK
jgi:hypothetical protein